MREFAWRVGIYTEEQTHSSAFGCFLEQSLRSPPPHYDEAAFWAEITGDAASPRIVTSITQPIHRLLHHLVGVSTLHRDFSVPIIPRDVFILWTLLRSGEALNLP